MQTNLMPIQVEVSIESLKLNREAFYNVCFITQSDTAPRTLEVNNLNDLLTNGYTRDSLAYNFCLGVFSQASVPVVYIRAKRSAESYEDAFISESNDDYYYTVIESKDLTVLSDFNDYLVTVDDNKLHFFSSDQAALTNKKVVQYYQEKIPLSQVSVNNEISLYHHYINKAYNLNYVVKNINLAIPNQFQLARLAYPESAWIGACGNSFPSKVQWLYKFLAKVDNVTTKTIPEFTTTSCKVLNNLATVGSGTTNQGIVINEQVSLDWVKWAIGRNVWATMYSKDRINSSRGGLDLITNSTKEVLGVAVDEGIFSKYIIREVTLNKKDNKVAVKFDANLTQTILNSEIKGALHY